MPKLRHLLLRGPRLQLPPSPMLMKIPRGCKTIIVMVLPLIGKEAMAAAVETRPVHLRLLHQGGTCKEVCFKENCHGSALLLLNFSCAEE
jgi:hypothetical protein